jgi:hypothetical protein
MTQCKSCWTQYTDAEKHACILPFSSALFFNWWSTEFCLIWTSLQILVPLYFAALLQLMALSGFLFVLGTESLHWMWVHFAQSLLIIQEVSHNLNYCMCPLGDFLELIWFMNSASCCTVWERQGPGLQKTCWCNGIHFDLSVTIWILQLCYKLNAKNCSLLTHVLLWCMLLSFSWWCPSDLGYMQMMTPGTQVTCPVLKTDFVNYHCSLYLLHEAVTQHCITCTW